MKKVKRTDLPREVSVVVACGKRKRAAGITVLAAVVSAAMLLGGPAAFGGERKTTPPPPERPRLQYWLRDPVPAQPQPEAAAKRPASAPRAAVVQTAARKTGGVQKPFIGPDGKRIWEASGGNAKGRKVKARKVWHTGSDALNSAVERQLKRAKEAYKLKNYERCVAICRNILIVSPRCGPAAALLNQAQKKLFVADAKVVKAAADRRAAQMLLETSERAIMPPPLAPAERPRLPRRSDDPMAKRLKKMNERLQERVEINFMNADLEWVFNVLFHMTGINIIADPSAMDGKALTLHVRNMPLREILDFIVRTNDGIQYTVTENAVWVTATDASDLKPLMIPRVYPIHHGLTSSVVGGNSGGGSKGGSGGGGGGGGGGGAAGNSYLETILSWVEAGDFPQIFPQGSKYILDYKTNQLLVVTTTAGHEQFEKLLDAFDQPPIQVAIRVRFLEVRGGLNKALGVQIGPITRRDSTSGVTPPDNADEARGARNPFHTYQMLNSLGDLSNIATGTSFVLKGVRTDPLFNITVNALLNNNRTKLLSEPYVLAINNKAANITIDTQFRYIEEVNWTDVRDRTDPEGNDRYIPRPVPTWAEENVGFVLDVTPSVGRDLRTINMHISPKIDSLHGAQQIADFQSTNLAIDQPLPQPTIDTTTLDTDVVLQDNGYVILGGLQRMTMEEVEKKVPGLWRIPGLGRLFRSKKNSVIKSNLVIIIEAQIITPEGRTYRKKPRPDDADIREGGVGYPLGSVSGYTGARRSEAVNSVLGLSQRPEDVRRAWEAFNADQREKSSTGKGAPVPENASPRARMVLPASSAAGTALTPPAATGGRPAAHAAPVAAGPKTRWVRAEEE